MSTCCARSTNLAPAGAAPTTLLMSKSSRFEGCFLSCGSPFPYKGPLPHWPASRPPKPVGPAARAAVAATAPPVVIAGAGWPRRACNAVTRCCSTSIWCLYSAAVDKSLSLPSSSVRACRGEVREVGVSFRLGLLLARAAAARARARARAPPSSAPPARAGPSRFALRLRPSNSGCAASTAAVGLREHGVASPPPLHRRDERLGAFAGPRARRPASERPYARRRRPRRSSRTRTPSPWSPWPSPPPPWPARCLGACARTARCARPPPSCGARASGTATRRRAGTASTRDPAPAPWPCPPCPRTSRRPRQPPRARPSWRGPRRCPAAAQRAYPRRRAWDPMRRAPGFDLCSAALGALSACSPSSTRRSTASPVSVKLLHPLIPFARTFAQADLSSSFAFSVKGAGSVIARGVLRKPRLRTRVHELRRSRKSRRFAKPRSPRRVRRGRRGARDRSETRRSREALSYRAESRSATSRLSRVRLESGEGLGPRDPISGALYFSGQPTPVRAEAR